MERLSFVLIITDICVVVDPKTWVGSPIRWGIVQIAQKERENTADVFYS